MCRTLMDSTLKAKSHKGSLTLLKKMMIQSVLQAQMEVSTRCRYSSNTRMTQRIAENSIRKRKHLTYFMDSMRIRHSVDCSGQIPCCSQRLNNSYKRRKHKYSSSCKAIKKSLQQVLTKLRLRKGRDGTRSKKDDFGYLKVYLKTITA